MLRKLTTALAIALALEFSLTLPALAGKAKWVSIWNASKGVSSLSVDQNSIKKNERYRYFWAFSRLSKPEYKSTHFTGKGYYLKSYNSVDCRAGILRRRDAIWMNNFYEVVYRHSPGDVGEPTTVKSNPRYAKVIKFVCSK
ncbi:MAG: surface-adhesin E family protein [Crinalium sp.]